MMIEETLSDIACCLCGTIIKGNQVNMCVPCLRNQVDITEGISSTNNVLMCKECLKYKAPGGEGVVGSRWLYCEPESAELLALCLKSIHGLVKGKNKKTGAKLVDAGWIWTEEHSRRLKMQITVEQDVFNGATLRQKKMIEFIVKTNLCDTCTKETTDQNWTTIVQVRQLASHKRTLLNLEQKLMKSPVSKDIMDIKPVQYGMDIYFATRTQGVKFSDYCLKSVPCRRKESKHLKSSDVKSNKAFFQNNICVEVVPICRDDCVILPTKLQRLLFGGTVGIVLVTRVQNTIYLADPFSDKTATLTESKYWPDPFRPIATARSLIEYTVLDVIPLLHESGTSAKEGEESPVSLLREVEVARTSDLGYNDERMVVMSHIGALLSPGDTVMGFDFSYHNLNDSDLKHFKGQELPSTVLVRRVRPQNDIKPRRKPSKKEPDTVATESVSHQSNLDEEGNDLEFSEDDAYDLSENSEEELEQAEEEDIQHTEEDESNDTSEKHHNLKD